MRVYFHTLGCRVNQYETDAVREMFIERGFDVTSHPEEADVCVVNTCTVTSEADRKSRQALRRMARLNDKAIICAMGCSSEMTSGEVFADVVCGTRDKHLLIDKVEEFIKTSNENNHRSMHIRSNTAHLDYVEFGTVLSPEGTRAYIKIEDGCNNFCTYCIIPYARGRVSSRKEDDVLEEVRNLASRGYSEICLTGIHLCSYGSERGEDIMALARLMKSIDSISGVRRISLGSLEPRSITDEFIRAITSIDKLSPHFHLSLQSGSDTVLTRMHRKYTASDYLSVVDKLRSAFPGMSLTTDIICGFPGETDEEFNETVEFVNKVQFSKIHVFPYSIREGTLASRMEQVPKNIARRRATELISWSDETEKAFASSLIGKEVAILIEKVIDEGDGRIQLAGYTNEYVYATLILESDSLNVSNAYSVGDIIKGIGISSHGSELKVKHD